VWIIIFFEIITRRKINVGITSQQPFFFFLPNTDGNIVEHNTNDDGIRDFILLLYKVNVYSLLFYNKNAIINVVVDVSIWQLPVC